MELEAVISKCLASSSWSLKMASNAIQEGNRSDVVKAPFKADTNIVNSAMTAEA